MKTKTTCFRIIAREEYNSQNELLSTTYFVQRRWRFLWFSYWEYATEWANPDLELRLDFDTLEEAEAYIQRQGVRTQQRTVREYVISV